MSLPLTPFERWQEGTTQPRLPVNDNSLRTEIFNTDGIANDVTAQPGSPDDGDWYIIPSGATGTQWATFAEDSIAIFYSGTWYEFVPADGNVVTVAGDFYIFDESDGWEAVTIPATGSAEDVTYDNTTSGLSAADVQAAIDELAAAPPGSGDVVGPGSAVDSHIVVFDSTTGKLIKDGGKTISEVRLIEQNSQSTAYTLVLADGGKHMLHPSADTTARTFTIPANSSVAYPVGTAITFVNQNGAGALTIAITTDTMRLAGAGTTGSRTLAANGLATALKVASTEWIINGTGLT